MTIQHDHGKRGEDLAVALLTKKGYEILERNWRSRLCEIDIIARHDGILIFVEVKTRSQNPYYRPENVITGQQWNRIAEAGGAYMRKIDYDWEVRFDLVGITLYHDDTHVIKHFDDVFFPGR